MPFLSFTLVASTVFLRFECSTGVKLRCCPGRGASSSGLAIRLNPAEAPAFFQDIPRCQICHIGLNSGHFSESAQVVRVTRPPMKGCPLPEAEVSLLPWVSDTSWQLPVGVPS